ncbi:MAG: tetratricopeptide repeat protein, partial [Bacteroidota bacterium]
MIGLLIGVFLVGNAYLTYQRNKIWKNSETLWTDVINTNPEVPVAYKNRGTFLAKNGRNEEALRDFNRYLELNPKDPLIFSNRGNLFSMQGKYAAAVSDYTQSLLLDSTSHEAWFNRGYTYFLMRQYPEAIRDYSQAISLNAELKERGMANRAM